MKQLYCQIFYDGTVKILDVKNLTVAEQAQIIAQYPELAGKEV